VLDSSTGNKVDGYSCYNKQISALTAITFLFTLIYNIEIQKDIFCNLKGFACLQSPKTVCERNGCNFVWK